MTEPGPVAGKATKDEAETIPNMKDGKKASEESVKTEVKNVQNVALADATAKQMPSLWTWRMWQVSIYLLLFCYHLRTNHFLLYINLLKKKGA